MNGPNVIVDQLVAGIHEMRPRFGNVQNDLFGTIAVIRNSVGKFCPQRAEVKGENEPRPVRIFPAKFELGREPANFAVKRIRRVKLQSFQLLGELFKRLIGLVTPAASTISFTDVAV